MPHSSPAHDQPLAAVALCLSIFLVSCGCRREQSSQAADAESPVVYCSVDEPFAREVFARYEARTGVRPVVQFDSEAGKTTGLVNKIIEEHRAGRPRVNVFWSGELFNTILLARQGLLEPYEPATSADIPARYRDPQHRWTAMAVRGRVLAFDPDKTPSDSVPARWEDLSKPGNADRLALANPLFGTTRGHVAAMFALWGAERGRAYLSDLQTHGVFIADGNSSAVRAVLDGREALAATDTDDVWVAKRRGDSIDLRYIDMGDGGALLIPCSVAIIAGQATAEAKKLVDFLASAEVERMLAESTSRNIPVRESLRKQLGLEWPAESKVSFEAIADAMDEAVSAVQKILIR